MTSSCDESACEDDDIKDPCPTRVRATVYYLESIVLSDNQTLVFFSTGGRSDSEENKLDSIQVVNPAGARIKSVIFEDEFIDQTEYYNWRLYDETLKHRMFLKKVLLSGITGTEPESYSFDYYDLKELPARLSLAQDHWGFYNQENNQYFVGIPSYYPQLITRYPYLQTNREPSNLKARAGMLQKIQYPTGGYTVFDYEQNRYSTMQLVYPDPFDELLTVFGIGCYDKKVDSLDYTIPYTQTQNVSLSVFVTENDTCLFQKNRHIGKIILRDLTDNTTIISERRVHGGETFIKQVNYIAGHTYRVIVKAYGNITEAMFFTEYYPSGPTLQQVDKYAGGIRLLRTTDYEISSGQSQITRYYYGDIENPNFSSGVGRITPIYTAPYHSFVNCFGSTGGGSMVPDLFCHYLMGFSSSLNNLFCLNGSHMLYETVIKSIGENFEGGGVFYRFRVDQDEPSEQTGWGQNFILGVPESNDSWKSGLPEYKLEFKSPGFVLQKETFYEYVEQDERKDTTVFGYVIKKHNFPYTADTTYYCSYEETLWSQNHCTTEHQHFYVFEGKQNICKAIGANNVALFSGCSNLTPGYYQLPNWAFANFDGMKYQIFCKWNYLEYEITKTYDENGSNPVTDTIQYKYNNPEHALVNETRKSASNGDKIKSCIYYPQDYSIGQNTGNLQALINKHMISLPVDERTLVNGKLSRGKITKYNDNGLPVEIFVAENELGNIQPFDSDNPFSYGVKVIDLSYNELTKNISQYQYANNIPVTYLWAYKNSYPVAEIKGASYSQVKSVLEVQGGYSIASLGESSSSSYIKEVTSFLRQNMEGVLVYSFTYDPPLGIISQTDPSGVTEYFKYDSFGRLIEKKDNNLKIIKEFEYNLSVPDN